MEDNRKQKTEDVIIIDGGVFSARLEALISAALKDGVLTEKEKTILKKRVEAEGENWDEVEMIIEARLAEMKPTATVTQVSQTQVQPVVMSSVQESPYLVVNGKEYKNALIDEIDEYILTNVTGLDASDIISVTIPSSVKGIKKNAFFGFYKLKELVIPSSVETIGEEAFDKCENLKTIVMPAALKEIKAPLGSRLEQLKKVDFSKVTQLRTIPKELFSYGCDKLKELMIPNGVTEIEDDAFLKLWNLKKLFLPPSLTTMGDFDRYSDTPSYKMTVYCYSPHLEELEPLVYGWDDEEDDDDYEDMDEEDMRELGLEPGKNNKIKTTLYVLPQYVDAYTAQRDAECIPNDVLTVLPIPDEYLYYYDN